MPHSAPGVMLLWSILSTIELIFLLNHLWRYDRFSVSLPPSSRSAVFPLIRSNLNSTVPQMELRTPAGGIQTYYDL